MRAGEAVGGAESKTQIRDRMVEVLTEIAETRVKNPCP